MNTIKLVWKRKQERYTNGHRGYLGKWPVASIDWDSGCPPKGKPYKLTNRLPGIKTDMGHYATEKEAQTKAGKVVQHWMGGINE